MIDLTIIISIILGVFAFIFPSIATIITCIYQYKTKKFENYDLARFKSLDSFSKFVGTHVYLNSGSSARDYLNSLYGLLPYFNISKSELTRLIDSVDNRNLLIDETNKLIKKLSRQIKPKK